MRTRLHSSPQILDRLIDRLEGIPSSDRFLIRIAFFVALASGIWIILSLNQHFSAITPVRGGNVTEGLIGTPRFVNPALALTRSDQDITALVYSGLMKIMPDGTLENDIADTITVSDDGLTYNVVLRKDIRFHDGTPLTARDVAFTIHLIQDPDLKSPLRGNWTDVTIEEISEYELNIVLREPYAPFIENFTLGIMPAHAWSSLPIEQLPFSQLNTEPIGSGPFMVTEAERDTSGLIDHYTLSAYRGNGVYPKIDQFNLVFFQNEQALLTALAEHAIDATAYIAPESIQAALAFGGYQLLEEPLPRIFGIFFNQNRSVVLRDQAVREALAAAIDRETLIDTTLLGHGVPTYTPTTLSVPALESEDSISATTTSTATDILEHGGWTKNTFGFWEKEIDEDTVTLSLTLRTSNAPLFEPLIESIAAQWEAIGVEVTTEQFEQTGLVQSVIRPRDFEVLLFGLDMSRSHELYPFWHSSQQDDPGLNIAQYANLEVDGLLENARQTQFGPERAEMLQRASTIISSEYPAIFLFQPTLTYLTSTNMTMPDMHNIGRPSDRFSNATEWHTESDSLWPMFRDAM